MSARVVVVDHSRRGAGPVDGKLLGRGSGEGFGVHICTVRGGELGDILEVRIMDVKPRPCVNPAYAGKAFGSNAAAWWGPPHRTETPRSHHDLRDRRDRTAKLGHRGPHWAQVVSVPNASVLGRKSVCSMWSPSLF